MRSLLSSVVDFVPCDRYLLRAHYKLKKAIKAKIRIRICIINN